MRRQLARFVALAWMLSMAVIRVVAQGTPPPNTPATPNTAPPSGGTVAVPTGPSGSTVVPTLPIPAQRPSLMIQRGGKQFEWRVSYSHSSKNAIFVDGVAILPIIVVGQVGVERVRRDVVTISAAARYGLADNLLIEAKVPFRYEHDRFAVPEVNPPQESNLTGTGIGDIEGALYYQLPRRAEDSIRWIANLAVKSDTGRDPFEIDSHEEVAIGTGFWNTKLGITGVKVVDPVAVYWSAGYTHNWERQNIPVTVTNQENGETTTIYVDVKPGNTYDIGGGFAYAVNPRFSINTGVSISFNGSSTSNGQKVPNSAVTTGSLRLGVVWLTEKRQPVDVALSIGLTDDSPDFSVEYRRDYRF